MSFLEWLWRQAGRLTGEHVLPPTPGPTPDPDPEPTPDSEHDPATVEELVEEAKFHVQFEGTRLDSFRQRAGWLLALNGVIIGLIAAQARETLNQASELGSVGRWIAAGALLAAAVFVLISVGLAFVALRKAKSLRWTDEALAAMPRKVSTTRSKLDTQGTFLAGLVARARFESKSVAKASRLIDAAFVTLILAIVSVAIYVGVFAVRTIEDPSPTPCPNASKSAAATPLASEDFPTPPVEPCRVSLHEVTALGGSGEGGIRTHEAG